MMVFLESLDTTVQICKWLAIYSNTVLNQSCDRPVRSESLKLWKINLKQCIHLEAFAFKTCSKFTISLQTIKNGIHFLSYTYYSDCINDIVYQCYDVYPTNFDR